MSDHDHTPGDQAPGPSVWTRWHLAGIAVAVMGFGASAWTLRRFVTDDAWITYRYAENLAAGLGFVWNPGGPVVEGYSNPLLVGIEVLALWLGLDAMDVARGIGVASGLGTILVVAWRGREAIGPRGAVAAAVLTGFVPGLAFWAVGGLETSLVTLLLTASVLELLHRDDGAPRRAGLVLAPLPWLRPEGLVVVLALGLFVGGHRLVVDRRPATAWRVPLQVVLPAFVAQVLLQVQRFVVFEHVLPNSAVYKADGAFAAVPLRFLTELGPLLMLAALGLTVLAPRAWVLAVPVVTYLVAGVNTADSVNAFSRFLLPTVPAVAVLAGGALQALATATRLRPPWLVHVIGIGATLTLVTVVLPGSLPDATSEGREYVSCRAEAREQAAAWLREQTPPETVYSISDAGLVPALADRTALDQFWLNDPRLQAHGGKPTTAHRADRLFAAEPDVIVLASERPGRFRAEYPTDGRIAAHAGFSSYRLDHVASGGEDCGYHLFMYRHRG